MKLKKGITYGLHCSAFLRGYLSLAACPKLGHPFLQDWNWHWSHLLFPAKIRSKWNVCVCVLNWTENHGTNRFSGTIGKGTFIWIDDVVNFHANYIHIAFIHFERFGTCSFCNDDSRLVVGAESIQLISATFKQGGQAKQLNYKS